MDLICQSEYCKYICDGIAGLMNNNVVH